MVAISSAAPVLHAVAYDVYVANKSTVLDLINNRITSVIGHRHVLRSPAHTDAAIKVLKDDGIRGTWCYGLYENPACKDLPGSNHETTTPAGFDHDARKADAKRAQEQDFESNDPAQELRTFGGAPTKAEAMIPDALKQEIDLSRSIGARTIAMYVAFGYYDKRLKIFSA